MLFLIIYYYFRSAESNTFEEDGWGHSPYVVSKVGVSALTIVQQKMLENDTSRPGILVNSVHPGYVKTDMTGQEGDLTVEQGAEAPLFLALLPKGENKYIGAFVWYDKRIFDWFGANPKNL